MKLYINGRFLTQKLTGVQRYAVEVVKAMDRLLEEETYSNLQCIIVTPKEPIYTVALKNISCITVGCHQGYFWEQIELPFFVKKEWLIGLCNCAPLFKRNQYVTIHDTAVYDVPRNYSWVFRIWYKFMYAAISKSAKGVFTVSKFSKEQIIRHLNIDQSKIYVGYNSAEHLLKNTRKNNDTNMIGNTEKYVLAVGSISPSKNFSLVLKTAALMPDVSFIIVGGKNNKVLSECNMDTIPKNVNFIGYVSDEDLIRLYQNAQCFVFPSLYEGFGIPPLEAMACGCPVVVSDIKVLREVCGAAALYCDIYDPNSMCSEIKKLFNDSDFRKQQIQNGFKQVKRYKWENTARMIFDIAITNDRK